MLAEHICGQSPNIVGRCFKCNKLGHTGKECLNLSSTEIASKRNATEGKITRKRKADSELKTSLIKKSRNKNSGKIVKQNIYVTDRKGTSKLGKDNLKNKKRRAKR